MKSIAKNRWFRRWCDCAVCLFLLLAGLPSGCSRTMRPPDLSGKTPILRVLIFSNLRTVPITETATASIKLKSEISSRRLDVPTSVPLTLSCSAAGWQLGSASFGPGELEIEPSVDGSVAISGHAYRGRYRFIARGDGTFDVINDVDVESYLKGVLARELFPNFAEAAYRAQAVVARTYAIYEKQTRPRGSDYDLFSDEHSQVYGGIAAETVKARQAVDDTHGIVVAYGPPGEERIFKAYFSSCCGGVGQSAAEAFGDPITPPLSAQANGTLCSGAPKFSWPPITLSKTELAHRIQHYGQLHNMPEKEITGISRIDIMSVNNVGRPVLFTITDNKNRRFAIVGEELRRAVNTDSTPQTKLPSSLFQLNNQATQISFINGHGLGHGVGMCQWCAEKRAEMGMGYEQIVLLSYPQSKLIKAYDWENAQHD